MSVKLFHICKTQYYTFLSTMWLFFIAHSVVIHCTAEEDYFFFGENATPPFHVNMEKVSTWCPNFPQRDTLYTRFPKPGWERELYSNRERESKSAVFLGVFFLLRKKIHLQRFFFFIQTSFPFPNERGPLIFFGFDPTLTTKIVAPVFLKEQSVPYKWVLLSN